MSLQPHQERVVTERASLNEDLTKLRAFIAGPVFPTLVEEERNLLTEQELCMARHVSVLDRRLALWGVQ